jgi:hypothetical protein
MVGSGIGGSGDAGVATAAGAGVALADGAGVAAATGIMCLSAVREPLCSAGLLISVTGAVLLISSPALGG